MKPLKVYISANTKVLKVALLIFMCFLSFGLIIAFSQGFLFSDPIGKSYTLNKTEGTLNSVSTYFGVAVSLVDQTVSMFLTVQIGLFFLIGFTYGKYFSTNHIIPLFNLILIVLFILCSFISIYLGYVARLQMFELVNAAKLDFLEVETTMARQALAVSFSAILAIVAASLPLVLTRSMEKCVDHRKNERSVESVEPKGDI